MQFFCICFAFCYEIHSEIIHVQTFLFRRNIRFWNLCESTLVYHFIDGVPAGYTKSKKEISSSTNSTHRFHTKRNRPHSQWFYVSPLAKVCMTHCPVVHRRGIWDGFLPTYTTYGNPIVLSHTSLDAFSANLKMDVRFTYLMDESTLLVLTFTGYIAVYFGATTQQHVSSRSK